MNFKILILKLIGWYRPSNSLTLFNKQINFTTIKPDQQLRFDEWSKQFNVSRRYSLLEDSEYLQKIKMKDISSISLAS